MNLVHREDYSSPSVYHEVITSRCLDIIQAICDNMTSTRIRPHAQMTGIAHKSGINEGIGYLSTVMRQHLLDMLPSIIGGLCCLSA